MKALSTHPIHFLNVSYNNSISNKFFNDICLQYNFQEAIIGPIDEEKVPADCFEAIAGFLYAHHGISDVESFWKSVLFSLPESCLNNYNLIKAVECLKMDINLNSFDKTVQIQLPKFVQPYMKGLNPPLAIAFDHENDYQQRCKMVGAALLKSLVALNCFKKGKDMKLVEMTVKKDTLVETVPKLGFPNPRIFKVFLGSIYLTNDYDAIATMFNSLMVKKLSIPESLRPPKHERT